VEPRDGKQRLMLARREASGLRLKPAELEETADQIAKTRTAAGTLIAGRGFCGTVMPDLYRPLPEKLNAQCIIVVQNDAAGRRTAVLNIYIVLRCIATRQQDGALRLQAGPPHESLENHHLHDFTTDARVLLIAAIAVVVATAGL
jgi:hypothetical protein